MAEIGFQRLSAHQFCLQKRLLTGLWLLGNFSGFFVVGRQSFYRVILQVDPGKHCY